MPAARSKEIGRRLWLRPPPPTTNLIVIVLRYRCLVQAAARVKRIPVYGDEAGEFFRAGTSA
jgi:hypothetical protein